jgi:very-short-patch-repair endonuclease
MILERMEDLCSDLFHLTIRDENGYPLYNALELQKYFNMTNIHVSSKCFTSYEKVLVNTKTIGGIHPATYYTMQGLKRLVTNSRKIKAVELGKHLGFELIKHVSYEQETTAQILVAFDGEDICEQYHVHPYTVDLYFQKYKLVIECDEKQHAKQIERDKERELFIKKKIGCIFIRYEPYLKDFDIFKVINQIYKHIKEFDTVM